LNYTRMTTKWLRKRARTNWTARISLSL